MMKPTFYFRSVLLFVFLFLFDPVLAQQASVWDQVPEEIRERNSFKRIEWFYRQRSAPLDTIPSHVYLAELESEIQKAIEGPENPLNNLQWNSIGPNGIQSGFPPHWGLMSGRVRGLDVHPTNPNIVYAGVAAGGIWKTTNGGTSWTNVGDNLASLTYGAIAIDPNNTNTVYAGAGEILYNFGPFIYEGQGLYKTTDGGASWSQITNGFGNTTHFGDLQVSPHNSNIVFAALGSGYWHRGNLSNEGIWRSTDGGVNWTRTLFVIDAFDVIVHPSNSTLVYAAAGGGVTSGGFWVSFDGGITWSQSNTGLPTASSILRMQISISNSSPSTVYGLIHTSGNTPLAYKSTNGGLSWLQISSGIPLGGNWGSGWITQGGYDLCIAVNPTNPNHAIVGNIELHQTTNGSTYSVQRVGSATNAWDCPIHVDLHRIVFAPSNSNTIYIGCDGGVYKSTDGGTTWASANSGLATIQFYRIASHPTKHDTLIGGAQDNGNFRTFNAGATPWGYTTTGDGMNCFFDHTSPNTIYLSTQNGNLLKSTNLGTNVTNLTFISGSWITPYFMHPTNNQWIYAANNSVLRSTNGGSSFSTIASNVSTSDLINTMSQSPVTPNNMIFAGSGLFTSTPQVKVSTDGGFTWTDITSNIGGTQRVISRVVCDPINANTMYVVRSGFTAGNNIYKTINLGVTWTNISGNLPSIPHNDFFVDPVNPTHYYAANDFGVYRSTNSGTTWAREGLGFPFVPAMDFDYAVSNGIRYLRVGTHGRSAFETDLDFIVPVELTSFTANATKENVELNWTTATELNNSGFEIQRSINDEDFIDIAFISGFGTTTEPKSYSYTDENVSGFIKYRLKQIDFNGRFEYSKIVEVNSVLNLSFELRQNYPNPFNPITNITYLLPSASNVKLTIFNSVGEAVEVLIDEFQSEGKYDIVWNGKTYPSGVYFYKIETESFTEVKKMILMK
ncbi:MAG: T9SS type A sorting domain-containing protein [Ignavibacteria bacterium]|nr:T9SS type A sorting domain-containing protein [Ignavibacteria bacterium]MBT8392572.1 T9SS type A sorting domain-containing protein [Ignavibacteria bacterium]NNJ53796.1 T9SS type A sorting domain-containing protein [Ignavibacteriaceae bacterium]